MSGGYGGDAPSSAATMMVSGHCNYCTWFASRRSSLSTPASLYIFHGTPWCPQFPAILLVDFNSARTADDGSMEVYGLGPSRPVDVDERIILMDEDDVYGMATVIKVRPTGDGITHVTARQYKATP